MHTKIHTYKNTNKEIQTQKYWIGELKHINEKKRKTNEKHTNELHVRAKDPHKKPDKKNLKRT